MRIFMSTDAIIEERRDIRLRCDLDWPTVPREGEIVRLDERTHSTVRSVEWDSLRDPVAYVELYAVRLSEAELASLVSRSAWFEVS